MTATPAISRNYQPDPAATARALELLLKRPVKHKAVGLAPEPDDRDDEKEPKHGVATGSYYQVPK